VPCEGYDFRQGAVVGLDLSGDISVLDERRPEKDEGIGRTAWGMAFRHFPTLSWVTRNSTIDRRREKGWAIDICVRLVRLGHATLWVKRQRKQGRRSSLRNLKRSATDKPVSELV
jgi:hypothetical protein